MPEITSVTRDEGLAGPPEARPRKRRFGVLAFGVVGALGLGLAGGSNLHRLVDLDQAGAWLHQTGSVLQSGFEAARTEIAYRVESFTSKPVSVAQASQEATSATPNSDIVERAVADLSVRVDQVRAAHDGTARDLGQGIDRIRSSAEQNHRELVAKLVQLAERVERIERQAAAAAAPSGRPARCAADHTVTPEARRRDRPAACAQHEAEGGPKADINGDEARHGRERDRELDGAGCVGRHGDLGRTSGRH